MSVIAAGEALANLLKLASSPVGLAILDKLVLGGQATPEKVAAALRQIEEPKPPKQKEAPDAA